MAAMARADRLNVSLISAFPQSAVRHRVFSQSRNFEDAVSQLDEITKMKMRAIRIDCECTIDAGRKSGRQPDAMNAMAESVAAAGVPVPAFITQLSAYRRRVSSTCVVCFDANTGAGSGTCP